MHKMIIPDDRITLEDVVDLQDMCDELAEKTDYTLDELYKMTPEGVQELYYDTFVPCKL